MKNGLNFGMIGGTWVGVNTRYPSHGGGYGREIPVKKIGFKQSGSLLSYYVWAREEYFSEEEARKMKTDLLHPSLKNVTNTLELENILKDDTDCTNVRTQNKYMSILDCAIVKHVIFDYLVIDANLDDLSEIKISDRLLNQETEVFSFNLHPKK